MNKKLHEAYTNEMLQKIDEQSSERKTYFEYCRAVNKYYGYQLIKTDFEDYATICRALKSMCETEGPTQDFDRYLELVREEDAAIERANMEAVVVLNPEPLRVDEEISESEDAECVPKYKDGRKIADKALKQLKLEAVNTLKSHGIAVIGASPHHTSPFKKFEIGSAAKRLRWLLDTFMPSLLPELAKLPDTRADNSRYGMDTIVMSRILASVMMYESMRDWSASSGDIDLANGMDVIMDSYEPLSSLPSNNTINERIAGIEASLLRDIMDSVCRGIMKMDAFQDTRFFGCPVVLVDGTVLTSSHTRMSKEDSTQESKRNGKTTSVFYFQYAVEAKLLLYNIVISLDTIFLKSRYDPALDARREKAILERKENWHETVVSSFSWSSRKTKKRTVTIESPSSVEEAKPQEEENSFELEEEELEAIDDRMRLGLELRSKADGDISAATQKHADSISAAEKKYSDSVELSSTTLDLELNNLELSAKKKADANDRHNKRVAVAETRLSTTRGTVDSRLKKALEGIETRVKNKLEALDIKLTKRLEEIAESYKGFASASDKQACEIGAFVQLLDSMDASYPNMKFCFVMDALYSAQEVI
ncbi:MAG: hypothetical protein LBT59_13065, partial [Clostridiales bacterium]|nr:hypothetical protein [Clostridiales bacterium]